MTLQLFDKIRNLDLSTKTLDNMKLLWPKSKDESKDRSWLNLPGAYGYGARYGSGGTYTYKPSYNLNFYSPFLGTGQSVSAYNPFRSYKLTPLLIVGNKDASHALKSVNNKTTTVGDFLGAKWGNPNYINDQLAYYNKISPLFYPFNDQYVGESKARQSYAKPISPFVNQELKLPSFMSYMPTLLALTAVKQALLGDVARHTIPTHKLKSKLLTETKEFRDKNGVQWGKINVPSLNSTKWPDVGLSIPALTSYGTTNNGLNALRRISLDKFKADVLAHEGDHLINSWGSGALVLSPKTRTQAAMVERNNQGSMGAGTLLLKSYGIDPYISSDILRSQSIRSFNQGFLQLQRQMRSNPLGYLRAGYSIPLVAQIISMPNKLLPGMQGYNQFQNRMAYLSTRPHIALLLGPLSGRFAAGYFNLGHRTAYQPSKYKGQQGGITYWSLQGHTPVNTNKPNPGTRFARKLYDKVKGSFFLR